MKKVMVIGGGPSGVMFALKVKALHPEYEVTIYEASDKILRRVLVSGNGRANFYNGDLLSGNFANVFDNPFVARQIIDKDNAKETLEFLESFDFPYVYDQAKRYYPFSNSSLTLYNVLVEALHKSKIHVVTNTKITKVDPKNQTIVTDKGEKREYDYLFLATGGESYDRAQGSNSTLYKSLDLLVRDYEPALCPLITKEKIPSSLVGTRFHAHLTLYLNSNPIYEEDGEILIKKDGLSGIAIFDASLFYNANTNEQYTVGLDLTRNGQFNVTERDCLIKPQHYLNDKLASYIKNRYHGDFLNNVKDVRFEIVGKYGFKDSQVSKGGVELSLIDPKTMKYQRYPNVYLGGETINLTAICGGYNMGLAFVTGYKAAKAIK